MPKAPRSPSSTKKTEEPTAESPPPGEGRPALGVLVCTNHEASFHAIPPRGSIFFGRGASCDVAMDDDSVSRKHAVIHAGAPPLVEDLGSRNGTTLQGARLAPGERRPVAVGDVIAMGSVLVIPQHGTAPFVRRVLDAPRPSGTPSVAAPPIVRDAAMQNLYRLVDTLSASRLPVLILGETGVGKDVYAEAIHARSEDASRPFVRLNCAALPEATLEGELFGYERGAFTGAVQAKPGLFEAADGGSVFLDEVGELPLATQAKLLRVLENGEVLRLGSVKPKRVRVRFVSATNRDLAQRVEEGAFRADLFFRLNGIAITLPPLRSRPEDLVALAHHFLEAAAARMGARLTLADDAVCALKVHAWPGNIRELRNVLERTVLLHVAAGSADGAIDASELRGSIDAARPSLPSAPPPAPPAETRPDDAPPVPLRKELAQVERQRVVDALEACGGNQSRAAKLLGIGRRTLLEKLDAHAIPRPRKTYDKD